MVSARNTHDQPRGGGTSRFRYNQRTGLYTRRKMGGGFLTGIGKGIAKSLTKAVPKILKATKPLGKMMIKKGKKAITSRKGQRRLASLAAAAGGHAMHRLTGNPEVARLAETQIKRATTSARRQLKRGRKVNSSFVKNVLANTTR